MRFVLLAVSVLLLMAFADDAAYAAGETAISAPRPLQSAKDNVGALAKPLVATTAQSLSPAQTLDLINDAGKAYQQGHLKESLKQLDRAQTEIRGQRLAYFRQLLPAAPEGWTLLKKPDDDGASIGAAFMGGGSTITRSFGANGSEVSIGYVVDSPMVSMFSGMAEAFRNLAPQDPNLLEIKGNRAGYEERARNGKRQHVLTIYAGDIVVSIVSETLPKDTLLQFAQLIDFDSLKQVP